MAAMTDVDLAEAEGVAVDLGSAVQVDPIKPELKPPGTKRLKLNCYVLLSTSAFKFNLRCYTWGPPASAPPSSTSRCARTLSGPECGPTV